MIEDYPQPSWDVLLFNEAAINGWSIPRQPARWKTLPIVRHFRALAYEADLNDTISPAYRAWMTNMIWRGWC